jgi:hypothetical protein
VVEAPAARELARDEDLRDAEGRQHGEGRTP